MICKKILRLQCEIYGGLVTPYDVRHLCSDIIGSGNVQRQTITWTNADLLSIRPWWTYFNEILFEILKFSLKKRSFKISSAKTAAILFRRRCVKWLAGDRAAVSLSMIQSTRDTCIDPGIWNRAAYPLTHWSLVPHIHWNGKVFILMKCSSLAALEVVKMTTSSAASDENFIKMTTFLFQCMRQ